MIIQQEINKAAAILRAGGLVAIPTETVYGLGADARNPDAIAKVFTAKQRPHSHPLIVHVVDFNQVGEWAREIPAAARQLAQAFWPGPLTLILKKRPEVLDIITGGQESIALRIPRHPVTLALLREFGGGLVAPSANRFTRVSPTTAEAVRAELGGKVDMILDGGACEVGLESTILDLSGTVPRILRPGMIGPEQLTAVLGTEVHVTRQDYPDEVRVPGMHHLHYSPVTRTELFTSTKIAAANLPAVCLTYSGIKFADERVTVIQMPSSPDAYAQMLYATLRAQDEQQYQRILIEAVPDTAEWDAIRDRIMKACGSMAPKA